jgi:hypothetical protein
MIYVLRPNAERLRRVRWDEKRTGPEKNGIFSKKV